jgi:hypothetical protein
MIAKESDIVRAHRPGDAFPFSHVQGKTVVIPVDRDPIEEPQGVLAQEGVERPGLRQGEATGVWQCV